MRPTLTAFVGLKGGTGCTGEAVRYLRSLDSAWGIDLDFTAGDFASQCGVVANVSIASLINLEQHVGPEHLATVAFPIKQGVHVIASPADVELGEVIAAETVSAVCAIALDSRDVVVDVGTHIDARALAVFQLANRIVFVGRDDDAALALCPKLVDLLCRAGITAAPMLSVPRMRRGGERTRAAALGIASFRETIASTGVVSTRRSSIGRLLAGALRSANATQR